MNPKVHGNGTPVRWQGQVYPSIRACAQAAGRSTKTLQYHLRTYGNLDRMGLGRGVHANHHPSPKAQPVGGYPSASALARAAGLPPKRVQRWRREGRAEELMLAMMRARERSKRNV